MARVRDFVEHPAGAAGAAALGVEGDEVIAERGEEAGLEEVGVEVRPREQRLRRGVAGELLADGAGASHRERRSYGTSGARRRECSRVEEGLCFPSRGSRDGNGSEAPAMAAWRMGL